ncbi:MAG: hypothetical protein HY667_01510 [Chloroflexi bacterium]|nr:hypothetical protein [Chloroflexota bacterium]
MSIEWFRDLSVIIFSWVTTIVLILGAVLAYRLCRRIDSILDSLKVTTARFEEMSGIVREELDKILQLAVIIRAFSKGVETVREFFKKGGTKDDQ